MLGFNKDFNSYIFYEIYFIKKVEIVAKEFFLKVFNLLGV